MATGVAVSTERVKFMLNIKFMLNAKREQTDGERKHHDQIACRPFNWILREKVAVSSANG